MKISILLPTRNGGALLGDCVRSVLDQPDHDVELVISDNASDDSTPDVLAGFADDPRVTLVRQDAPIPVTDNWNRTLEAATGDYVLLLGDDDAMMPGSLARLRELLERHDRPEVLSFEAFGFAFPGALGDGSVPHFSDPLFPYGPDFPGEGLVSKAARERCVRELFRFEMGFCLNLQSTLTRRDYLLGLRSGGFREPYPDFYAVAALLLIAPRWAHARENLVVMGVSPKSFGRTLKGGKTDSEGGRTYLGVSWDFPGFLPGTDMLNGTHVFLARLLEDYGAELPGVEISRSNYVYRQVYDWYLNVRLGTLDRHELGRRIRLLKPSDWAGFAKELAKRFSPDMVRRHARVGAQSAVDAVWPGMRPIPEARTIAEFVDWAARHRPQPAAA